MARKNTPWQPEWHKSRKQFCDHYVGNGPAGLNVLEAHHGLIENERCFMDANERQHYLAGVIMDIVIHTAIQEECTNAIRENKLEEAFTSLITNQLIMPEPGFDHAGQAQQLMQRWRRDQVGNDPSSITSWLANNGQVLTVLPSEEAINASPPKLSSLQRDYLAKEQRHNFRKDEHPAVVLCNENAILHKYFSVIVPPPKSQGRTIEKASYRNESTSLGVKNRDAASLPVGRIQDINRITVLPETPQLENAFYERLNLYRRYHSAQNVERPDFLPEARKLSSTGYQDRKTLLAITSRNRFGDPIEAPANRSFEGTVSEIVSMSPHMYTAKQATHGIYEVQRLLEFGSLNRLTSDLAPCKLVGEYEMQRHAFLKNPNTANDRPALAARIQNDIPATSHLLEQIRTGSDAVRTELLSQIKDHLQAMHHAQQIDSIPQEKLSFIGEEFDQYRMEFLQNETYHRLYPSVYACLEKSRKELPSAAAVIVNTHGEKLDAMANHIHRQLHSMQLAMHTDGVRQSSKSWRNEWLLDTERTNQNARRQGAASAPFAEDLQIAVAHGKDSEEQINLVDLQAMVARRTKQR